MPITPGYQISRIFYSAILKASGIPHISASNIFLFESRATFSFCHSSLILSFFQTTAASVVALFSLDLLKQRFKSAIPSCPSKIGLFLSSISSFPGNIELEMYQIGLVSSARSIIKLTEICQARR